MDNSSIISAGSTDSTKINTLVTRMNKTLSLSGSILLLLAAGIAQAETLVEIYEKATRNDPAIREAEANMLATMENKPLARASLLPQIDANADWRYTNSDGTRTFAVAEGAGGSFDGDTDSRQRDYGWSVDLRQSLFNWDQWRQLKKADREAAQAEVDYSAAQQDLMVRVTEAYFDVLAAQDTLASERASKEAIGRQLEQAERRFEVGLIAITDVKEAQAAYDDAVALEISAQRSLASAKERLREITGEYPQELANPGQEFPLIPPEPQIEQDWVDISMQQNLRLESAKVGMEITRENIQIARGGYTPTLDFTASIGNNSNRGESTNITPQNPNPIATPTDRDIDSKRYGVQFSLPLFQGGGTSSRVQQEVYRHRASRENYEKVARETERETRDAYLGVIAEIARVRALARSEESNRTALEATEAGYEVGTRTTVDVLDARRSLFLAQTQYARSKYDYLINVVKLKLAAGTLTSQDIVQLNNWLVTEEALPATPGRGDTPDIEMESELVEPGGKTVPMNDSAGEQPAEITLDPPAAEE